MNSLDVVNSKIKSFNEAESIIRKWKLYGESVVFTNGCFDLLHYGHIDYLSKSKDYGTKLVVGINSDDSISRIKGSNRPINNQKSRLYNIASMFFVDMVVVFNDDTPLSLIKALCPNIITKGGDWNLKDIVGYEFMTERGGRIYTIPHITGYSTTNLENKILNKLF